MKADVLLITFETAMKYRVSV